MALLRSLELGSGYKGTLTLEDSAGYLLSDKETLKYLCQRYKIPCKCLVYACKKYRTKSIRWVLSLFLTVRKNLMLKGLHIQNERLVALKVGGTTYFSLWHYTRQYVEEEMAKKVLNKMVDLMDLSDEGTFPIRQVCSHKPDAPAKFGYLGLLVGILTGTHSESEIPSMEDKSLISKHLSRVTGEPKPRGTVRPNRVGADSKVAIKRVGLNIPGLTDDETDEVEPFLEP